MGTSRAAETSHESPKKTPAHRRTRRETATSRAAAATSQP